MARKIFGFLVYLSFFFMFFVACSNGKKLSLSIPQEGSEAIAQQDTISSQPHSPTPKPSASPSPSPNSSQNPTSIQTTYVAVSSQTAVASCANIQGRYYGGTNVFDFVQQGCRATSTYDIGGFRHVLTADLAGNIGFGSISRTTLSTLCTTRISIQVGVLAAGNLEVISRNSDGQCDLPVNWAQYALLSQSQTTTSVAPPPNGALQIHVPIAQLNSTAGGLFCNSDWTEFSNLSCLLSAASRYCVSNGYKGGILQEYDPSSGWSKVSCALGEYLASVTFDQLAAALGSPVCSGNSWSSAKTLLCTAATSRFCRSKGYAGGYLQEYDGTNNRANIFCKPGTMIPLPISELTAKHSSCINDWNNFFVPLACAAASSRYCMSLGYSGGGYVQEWDGGSGAAIVLCQ